MYHRITLFLFHLISHMKHHVHDVAIAVLVAPGPEKVGVGLMVMGYVLVMAGLAYFYTAPPIIEEIFE